MSLKLATLRAELAAAPAQAETRLLSIFGFVIDEIDDAIDSIGVEAVIVEVLKLYDEFVAPVDIPWIPSLLEPALIDAPAKQLIAATIRRAHSRIHKD
jgi:molybdopterin-guanine dinucleotide biosynthesis protein A